MDQKLPNEILTLIFDYLPAHSLHIAAKVSTRWSQIVKTLDVCWLDFSLIDDDDDGDDEKKMIAYIKNKIASDADGARMRHILVLSDRLLPNNVFLFIQRKCPNVISFDYDPDLLDTTTIASANDTQLHPFLGGKFGWPFIRHLPACCRNSDFPWIGSDLCQPLESLYARDGDFILESLTNGSFELNYFLTHLDDLTVHTPIKTGEKTINRIHDLCPRLTALTLRDMQLTCIFCPRFGNTLTFGRAERNLKVLKLDNVSFLNHRTFDYFPSKYPNIQTLTLSTKYYYDDRLYNMVIRFKNLIKLVVHLDTDFGTNKDYHLHRCRRLQDELQAYYCSHPTTFSSPHHQQRVHFQITWA